MDKEKLNMTITEYYEKKNYDKHKKYDISITKSEDITVDDFYNNCIAKHISHPDYVRNAIEWHNMLVQYAEDKESVLWVRYHENGPKDEVSGRYKTRRACQTIFQDGFSYVFVSNYDAHEIFNMVRLGVKPDLNEFRDLMKNHNFPLHFDKGGKCEESDICAYPNIGTVKGGVLTTQNLYLAHIIGVKSDVYVNRKTKTMIEVDSQRLYPAGEISDWGKKGGINVRELDYSLSGEEKEIIRAHFIRFVSPLNYYVLPGKDYQKSRFKGQIGENTYMNNFVREKYSSIYKTLYNDFERMVLAPKMNEIFISCWPKETGKLPPKHEKGPDVFKGKEGDVIPSNAFNTLSATYKSSVKTIMNEMGLSDFQDLDVRIDDVIDFYTTEIDSAKKSGDNKRAKLYTNRRSALKKYKEFMD